MPNGRVNGNHQIKLAYGGGRLHEIMQVRPEIDEAHMFAPHYDRHVWIYRDNPNGVFAPLNPAVTCAYHRNAHAHTMHSTH